MLLLADENFPLASYNYLENLGYDIFRPLAPGPYLHKIFREGLIKFPGYLTVIDEHQIRQCKI